MWWRCRRAGDEDAVGALAPGAGDPALADRVRARRLDRRFDDPHAGRGEDGAERGGVLSISVPDQELQAVGPLPEVHEDVPGLLDRPCGGRAGGDAGQVNAAIVVLDNEQHTACSLTCPAETWAFVGLLPRDPGVSRCVSTASA